MRTVSSRVFRKYLPWIYQFDQQYLKRQAMLFL